MDDRTYWSMTALRGRTSRRGLLRGAAVAGAGLAGAALIGCGQDEPAATPRPTATPTQAGTATPTATPVDPFAGIKRGGTLNFQLTNDPPTIDTYGNLSFLTKGISAYPYSRLYQIASRPDENPWAVGVEPDLAASAETADGQSWVVKIVPNAKFHNKAPVNGRQLTSEDVVASFRRLKADDSPGKDLVASWTHLEAIDDLTVRFTLNAPTAVFLDDLADTNRLFVLPKEAFSGGFNPATSMIGSGPWVLENYTPAVGFKFSKNPAWHQEGRPFADGLDLAIIPEYGNRLAQFQAGNSHSAGINANDVLNLRREQPNVQWRGVLPALLSFIYFAPKEREPDAVYQDERFRQGISMMTDRDQLTELGGNVKALQQAGLDVSVMWNNLVPAGFARWWLDPKSAEMGDAGKFFKFDPAEGMKLVEAAGYAGETIPYIYTNNIYGTTFNSIAEAANNYIVEGGVKTEVQTQDYSSIYITQTFRSNFSGMAFGYETPFPEVGGYFTRMFGPDPANHSRISDPEITALDKKQQVELDYETRRGYVWDIQRINAQHMYYVPSQAGAVTGWTAYRPEVRGISQTRGYGTGTENLPHFWLDV
jgi:peptide/nickel transport system substrate-binding protein